MKIARKSGERGFALLLVFLLAAAIALMLYVQMPRVAFESERDKEQLLIDRGEQFKRAIQLYVVANKRYPARLEDLENTNDKRYLRKRYIDPYTGKNEWRLVHTNGMYLTDSLVQKPPAAPDDKNKDQSASNTPPTPTTSTLPGGAPQPADVNATVLQRPSDRTLPTGVPGQGTPGALTGDYANQYQQNQNYPPITLAQMPGNGAVGPNGLPLPNGVQGNYPGTVQPGGQNPAFPQNLQQLGIQPGGVPAAPLPGGGVPGAPLPGGVVAPGQANSQIPQNITDPAQLQAILQARGLVQDPATLQQQVNAQVAFANQQFQQQQLQQQQFQQGQLPQAANPQGGPQGGQNTAIGLINSLLTTPRTPPPGIGGPASNNTLGAGIAGVASTYTGPAIKSYNTKTHYNEWEFVFTYNQQQQATPQQNQQNQTNSTGGTNGTPPPGQNPLTGPIQNPPGFSPGR
jgi:hypothetical protein